MGLLVGCAAPQAADLPAAPQEAAAGREERPRPATSPARTTLPSAPVEQAMAGGLPVRLNGHGPFRLGFDSGQSFAALVSRDLADRLALPVVDQVQVGDGSGANDREVDVVAIASLTIGAAQFHDLQALVFDIPGDGALGFALFVDALLTLDFVRDRMRIERAALPPPDGREVLALGMQHGATPTVPVEIGDRQVTALIDTGWNGATGAPAAWMDELPLESPPVVVGRAATLFNEFEIHEARLDGALSIGGHSIPSPALHFNDLLPELVLGRDLLSRFAISFDQANLRVRFRE